MMKIKLVCVGSIKENFFKSAIDEYAKRLQKFCKLEIIEVKQGKSGNDNAKAEEYAEIVKHLEGYVCVLAIEGKQLSSPEFAEKLNDIATHGGSVVSFVIGGSFGVDDRIKNVANFLLSFSKMTFPHQLFRVLTLEQIYRAFNIQSHTPYHK